MSRRRNLQAATEQPPSPDSFAPNQVICLVGQSKGSNVFEVTDVTGQTLLVELPSKFRKSVWIRRGSYVIVARTEELSGTKLQGVIEFVITADLLKEWKRKGLWPEDLDRTDADEDQEAKSNVVTISEPEHAEELKGK